MVVPFRGDARWVYPLGEMSDGRTLAGDVRRENPCWRCQMGVPQPTAGTGFELVHKWLPLLPCQPVFVQPVLTDALSSQTGPVFDSASLTILTA